ncbi:MAG: hypothetical protein M1828_004677 [Chrysothrix sp. TS-e1954]|nr:MAG: hypothetical protein M1828_004677 [Chrysothrix sp. TS-e1954]
MVKDHIDKKNLEILSDNEKYTSLADLADELPENTPRFVLLSHPLTLPDGRTTAPYVLLSYLPQTCTSEARMLYAGARELMRTEAETSRVIEVEDEEGVLAVKDKLMEQAT